MPIFLQDDFESVGGQSLIGSTADIGGVWVDYNLLTGWTDGAGFVNAGGGFVGWDFSRGIARSPATPGNAFGQYDCICRHNGGGDGVLAIFGRFSSSQATGYYVSSEEGFGTNVLHLRRVDNDVQSGISVSKAFTAWTTNRTLSLKFEDLGGGTHRITALVDGVVELTIDDTSPIAGAGFAMVGGRNASMFNLSAADTVAADTTPPTITGPGGATGSTSSVSVAENTTAVHTFTANESVTWSLNGGADVARFTINSGTGALAFLAAPDFETPTDADTNNTYIVGVRATDAAGNATTQTCTVTVTDVSEGGGGTAPNITAQPGNQTVTEGATATFTVTATGTGTLTYQWRKNGTNISGATSSSYTTPATVLADNGALFSVVVTGDTSPPATSNNATLTVNAAGTAASLVLTGFKTWTGIPYTSTSVNFVKVCRVSTGAVTLELAGQPINASGSMTISSPALVASADYMVFGFNADGSLSFKKKVTAA